MRNERPLFTISALALGCAASLACASEDAPDDAAGGSVVVQISGEELATDGFRFPSGSEVTLADGWEIEFSHVLVTVGNVTLAEDPNRSPTDQSQTGKEVARADGPWAVDLALDGEVEGAGGEGRATLLTEIANQNRNAGEPFDPALPYAFGYDVLAATREASIVNFGDDAGALAVYDEMIAEGYAVLYAGTATFRGEDCEASDAGYDFSALPRELSFRIGFRTPVSNLNCQNAENDGDPFPDESYARGIQVLPNRAALAQLTFHLDHPFFSDVEHEPTLYFDQMAARLVGREGETLTLADFAGVDPTAFTDAQGDALPSRRCDGESVARGSQRSFELGSVTLDPEGEPDSALRDYRDYVEYVQSTQGHLNGGEGLCFVRRNYPSPR